MAFRISLSIAAPLCGALLVVSLLYSFLVRERRRVQTQQAVNPHKLAIQDVYSDITPLQTLNWRVEEPLKVWPFRPRYHLTMALESLRLSDLVLMDQTYLTRIQIRRHLHHRHGPHVINCNDSAIPAVNELYEWMTRTYLPKRLPTMFQLSKPSNEKAPVVRNLVTGEDIPTTPDPDPFAALRTLSSHVDTDFIFLLPTSSTTTPPSYPGLSFHPSSSGVPSTTTAPDSTPKYHLHAYIGCFPSGFDWLDKFSLPLASIHTPVPHYAEKLERSMDRFFATIPTGKLVGRKNWAVTTDRELYKTKGNHGDASGAVDRNVKEEVDLSQTVLRCERQTLHRLPGTGALVFGFKTFQYELDEVRREGSGVDLADAIEGLGEGSAPRARLYKKADVWGEKVCEYLRS